MAQVITEESFVFPASFAQQRLWFLDQLEPDSPAYNIPAALRMKGEIDPSALKETLNEIVRRHESLRTTFSVIDGQPVQIVGSAKPHVLLETDLRGMPEAEREAHARRLASEEALRPFDLANGPMLRTKLLRLAEDEYIFLLTMHHIVSDQWSAGIFFRELVTLYERFSSGDPTPLPDLPIQYADFALWQREWLQSGALDRQLAYWKEQLGGRPPVVELPTDYRRPPVQTLNGSHKSYELPRSLTESLLALSLQEGVTVFMLLLAAYQTLLHRCTGQDDITVGSPIANRNRSEIEGIIGFFINVLVMRTDLSGDPTFRQLLGRVREVALGAYDHQDVPFEKLVDALQPERDTSRSPLFQVAFQVQNADGDSFHLPNLKISSVDTDVTTSKFDLSVTIVNHPKGMQVGFEYNTDLFEGTTIDRMMGHFRVLLGGIVANPDHRISELPLLTEAETQTLLVEWNDTRRDYDQAPCVHHLFEAQAERSPEAVAVILDNSRLTYGDLNRRANCLAHHLRKQGVGSEARVGILLDQSLEMVVGLLGVLKAGGAYVPLNPANPSERLAFMLDDAQASLLLTQRQLSERFAEYTGNLVYLDSDWDEIAQNDERNPHCDVTRKNLISVLYTSGSTGRPKGTMIEHRGFLNLCLWYKGHCPITEKSKVLLIIPFSFDAAFKNIVAPLMSGAELVLAGSDVYDPVKILETIENKKVTVINSTPSQIYPIIDLAEANNYEALSSLEHLSLGGEPMAMPRLRPWLNSKNCNCSLIQLYGPSECSDILTSYRTSRGQIKVMETVPIGKPIDNVRLYVLNKSSDPQPVGIVGELRAAGPILARGYINRPDLTAESFLPNPFGEGERIYRTGDLVRTLPDGNLEFVGRIDNQVKIRGIRIELGEIEAALRQHPLVREAVVVVRETINGKQLVAYLLNNGGQPPAPTELRSYMKDRLPQYMTPKAFVMLESLPLTPNGKLDRQALPEPKELRQETEETYVEPRNPVEQAIARIWAEVLRVEKAGIHDNFFELGGDSILSIQVVAKANQAGLRISPKQIFHHQTIAELAVVAEPGAAATAAEQGPVSGGLPLTPIQHWFFDNFSDSAQNLTDPNINQALLFELIKPVDPSVLRDAFLALLRHHDALRMRFSAGGGGWSQTILEPDDLLSLSVFDFSTLADDDLAAAIEEKAQGIQSSLDIEAGPILRVALFELGVGRAQRLLIVIHHLAVDAVSWRILLEDLNTAVEQLKHGGPVKLPPKTTSIKEWAELLTEYAQSEVLKQELEYWADACDRERRPLPRDYAGGDNTYRSVETVSATLTAEQTRELLQELPAAYKSEINDVLLTALARTFCLWTGSESQMIELEGHGREEIIEEVDLSRTIGWFTTLFPVKLRVEQTATAPEALRAIKQQLRALPGRGIGYGLLRYLTKDAVARDRLVPASQPEVSFNYLGRFDETVIEGAALRIARESAGSAFSPQARRTHLIEINAAVGGGRLHVNWAYSPQVHSKATVEGLADRLMWELRELIRESGSGAESYTPADFPLARIDQQQLERILSRQADVEDIYPLSPFQNQLLLYKIQSPKSEAYVGQLSCTFHGGLNTSAFKRAWQAAMGRHETLRTSFVWEDLDNPLQVVHRQVELPWQQYDWARMPPTEQQERLKTFAREDRVRGFDLPKAPLMRFSFIRLAEDAYQFIWSHDHLLLDGWSLPLLLKDVFAFYEAFSRGEDLHLRQSPPFKDYIGWLQRQDLCEAEEFWRKAFDGFTAPRNMKSERMSSSQPAEESNGEQQTLLSSATMAALQSLARRHKLTLNTVVQGAWALLLSQYSGVRDVVFGVVVSGRPGDLIYADVRLGLFINTLPLRVQISPDEPVPAWLEKLQSLQAEMLRYDYTPLAQIQRWSGTTSPLFESILRFQNYPVDTTVREASGNFTISDICPVDIWPYPLSVVAVPGEQLSLTIGYDERRFDAATINSMLCGMETILEQMAVNPYQRLCQLSLTKGADQKL